MAEDLDIVLPADQWKGRKVRQLTGMSHYGPLAGFDATVVQHARPVAYIRRADGVGGTGFLVAPDLLLTNQHVLRTAEDAATCEVWFDYRVDAAGTPIPVDVYRCAPSGPGGFFYASPFSGGGVTATALDFALVRINNPASPGIKWGFLPINGYEPTITRQGLITIIQHPQQRPTEVGQGENQVQFKSGLVVQYVTDTEGGSSGSPVFNHLWQVIALHHAGVTLPPDFGSGKGNEGIYIPAIVQELQAHAPGIALPSAP